MSTNVRHAAHKARLPLKGTAQRGRGYKRKPAPLPWGSPQKKIDKGHGKDMKFTTMGKGAASTTDGAIVI